MRFVDAIAEELSAGRWLWVVDVVTFVRSHHECLIEYDKFIGKENQVGGGFSAEGFTPSTRRRPSVRRAGCEFSERLRYPPKIDFRSAVQRSLDG